MNRATLKVVKAHNALNGIDDDFVSASLTAARHAVGFALDEVMRHEGLDPEDTDDLMAAETLPQTAALRAALRMLEGEVLP